MTNIFYFSHFSRYVIGGSVLSCFSRVCLFATPWTVALQAPLGRRRDPSWDSPGKNTGVGSLSLFQGIFPTQGLNWGFLHCRWVLYLLSYEGSLNIRRNSGCIAHGILQARILEWVAYPFSCGSYRPRSQTWVSCIADRFFTNWAIREALEVYPSCSIF